MNGQIRLYLEVFLVFFFISEVDASNYDVVLVSILGVCVHRPFFHHKKEFVNEWFAEYGVHVANNRRAWSPLTVFCCRQRA